MENIRLEQYIRGRKHTSPNIWTCIDKGTGPYRVGETHEFLYDNLNNWFTDGGLFILPFECYLNQIESL